LEREQLIRSALTDDATYCDPRANRLDIPRLLEHISNVHQSRPGATVRRTSNVDAHHGLARFHWHVVMPDGTTLPEGIDFIELSPDGTRIARVVGFFGPLRGAPQSDA
jgi:hypothetical protein